jgi:hypothetical protein
VATDGHYNQHCKCTDNGEELLTLFPWFVNMLILYEPLTQAHHPAILSCECFQRSFQRLVWSLILRHGQMPSPPNVIECSTLAIPLSFTFSLFGDTSSFLSITSEGFLEILSTPRLLLDPFFADVNILNGGDIYYKEIDSNSFAVAWVNVERFGTDDGKTNTFQVLISNGSIGGRKEQIFATVTMTCNGQLLVLQVLAIRPHLLESAMV